MTLGDVGVVISCVGHLHSNSCRANLFEVRPLIINSFYFPHFKAALMLFKVRSLFGVLGYTKKIENGQFDLTFDVICWGLPGFCSISFFW